MQDCTDNILCPETTTTTTTTTVPPSGEDSGGILSGAVELAGEVANTADATVQGAAILTAVAIQDPGFVAGEAVDAAIDATIGDPIERLNQAAEAMAGSAFGDLAAHGLTLQEPSQIVLAGLGMPLHLLAGYVAFGTIVATVLAVLVTPRRTLGSRVIWASEAYIKYLLISSFGVVIGVGLIQASQEIMSIAIDLSLPETIDTSGVNIYTGALASVVVPITKVSFQFQSFFVAALIATWPIAAAISILRSFRHLLPVITALLVANAVWPPLAALAIGQAFAALPDVSDATWWTAAAFACAPICNFIALTARNQS